MKGSWGRSALWMTLVAMVVGCSQGLSVPAPLVTSVTPSAAGSPNTVVSFGSFSFVSVQGTGQIFSYIVGSGYQTPVGPAYAMPCSDPSGMVIGTIAGSTVMAVACYDTGQLVTLTVHGDGTLSALGVVGGLPSPFPGIVLDGANVFLPLYGSLGNGGVAKVSLANPAAPVVVAIAILESPVPGGDPNAGFLAVGNGKIYVAAGSESAPLSGSSSIQVVDEATMALVGVPLPVAHSPQQIVVQGNVAYVTFYDAAQMESINLSNPLLLVPLEVLPLQIGSQSCHAIPVLVTSGTAYVGCYAEGVIEALNVSNPAKMQLVQTLQNIPTPERFSLSGDYLLVTSGAMGGSVYAINPVALD